MIDPDELEAGCDDIGARISNDLYYLVPSGAKRFEPVTMASAVATLLVGAFASGMVTALTQQAREAGTDVGNWLSDKLSDLFATGPETEPPEPADHEEVVAGLAELERMLAKLDAPAVEQQADAIQTELASELTQQSMPEQRATQITVRVREVTMELVK